MSHIHDSMHGHFHMIFTLYMLGTSHSKLNNITVYVHEIQLGLKFFSLRFSWGLFLSSFHTLDKINIKCKCAARLQ